MTPPATSLDLRWLHAPDGRLLAAISPHGARLVQLFVPDVNGEPRNVVLGFDRLAPYVHEQPSMGALIGRWAGRLSQGRLRWLDATWQLPLNSPEHCLHGGPGGSRHHVFDVVQTEPDALRLQHVFTPQNDGFPGELTLLLTLRAQVGARLEVDWQVRCDGRPTVCNLTWHPFFNLAGDAQAASLARHVLQVPASHWLPTDATQRPLGGLHPVRGSGLDVRRARCVGEVLRQPDGRGLDHSLLLSDTATDSDALHASPRCVAHLHSPDSGIHLHLHTQEPLLHLYGGQGLAQPFDTTWRGAPQGATFAACAGLCLEPTLWPDAPNQRTFPFTPLQPGEGRSGRWIYQFTAS